MQNRTDLPRAFDQRSLLMTLLDYTRATTAYKCEGLSDADARTTPLPTSPMMSISGLVSHLRWVEWSWIEERLLGETADHPWIDPDDPDREFHYELDRPLSDILADYQAQSALWDAPMVVKRLLQDLLPVSPVFSGGSESCRSRGRCTA